MVPTISTKNACLSHVFGQKDCGNAKRIGAKRSENIRHLNGIPCVSLGIADFRFRLRRWLLRNCTITARIFRSFDAFASKPWIWTHSGLPENTMHTDTTYPSLFVCSAAALICHSPPNYYHLLPVFMILCHQRWFCAIRREKGNAAQADLSCDVMAVRASLRVCVHVIYWKYKIAHRIAKQCRSR